MCDVFLFFFSDFCGINSINRVDSDSLLPPPPPLTPPVNHPPLSLSLFLPLCPSLYLCCIQVRWETSKSVCLRRRRTATRRFFRWVELWAWHYSHTTPVNPEKRTGFRSHGGTSPWFTLPCFQPQNVLKNITRSQWFLQRITYTNPHSHKIKISAKNTQQVAVMWWGFNQCLNELGKFNSLPFFNRTSEVLNAEKDASVFRWFPFKHTFYSQQTAPLLVNQWLSRPFMYYLRPWSLLRYSDWSAASREVKVHEGSVDRFPWSWLVRSIAVLFSALYFHPSFTPRLRTLSWGYMVSVTSTSVSWYT